MSDQYFGNNYGSTAVALLIDKLLSYKIDISKIINQILTTNVRSEKSVIRSGFYFNKYIVINGSRYKEYIYNMLLHKIIRLEYPYLKHFMSNFHIHHLFSKLQAHRYKYTKKNGIIINFIKDRKINKITDYFTDYCRVRCRFKHNQIPLQHYKKNKGTILGEPINGSEGKIYRKFNIDVFESVMYNSKTAKFCNNFPITLAITIYKMFKPNSIFDSSAGWGDRLIAAIAYGASYTGVDPSNCLYPMYSKIINTLAKHKSNYRIIKDGIENITVGNDVVAQFDMCLTSPPFFDLEEYEDDDKQSIKKYKNELDWENIFLMTLINTNIKVLKPKGHLLLYFPNKYKTCFKHLMQHKKLNYRGQLPFYTPYKRIIYIWKKI